MTLLRRILWVTLSACHAGPAHLDDTSAVLDAPVILSIEGQLFELGTGWSYESAPGRNSATLVRAEDQPESGCLGDGPVQVGFGWETAGLFDATAISANTAIKAVIYPDLVQEIAGLEATRGWVRIDNAGPERLVGSMSWAAEDEDGARLGYAEGGFDIPLCGQE